MPRRTTCPTCSGCGTVQLPPALQATYDGLSATEPRSARDVGRITGETQQAEIHRLRHLAALGAARQAGKVAQSDHPCRPATLWLRVGR